MMQLRRTAATAEAYDLECELISPERARELYPILETARSASARSGCRATARPTRPTSPRRWPGAPATAEREIIERTRVIGITQRDGAVTGVRTDRGDIEAEIVVNCAGQWAKAVGALAGVNVPLHSAEHFYVVTEQIDGVHRNLPILRDPDGYTYFKEEVGGLVVGGFEPEAKPWVAPDQLPYPFEFQLLDEDWDHFSILMESALLRIPALQPHRDQEVLQRPRELHPRQPVHPGRGARAQELLRRRRVQLGRHRLGRRGRTRAGRMDRRTASRPAIWSRSTSARFAPFNGNNQWLHDRVARDPRACTTRCRGRIAN